MKTIYPWQKNQWQLLQTQREQNRLPHALLFVGPEGMGQYEFALHFSRTLLCNDPAQDHEQTCRNCRLFNSQNHPDFFHIRLEKESKTIKVEPLRELITQLNQTSQRNGYQVVIINPAETMTTTAANALLKTLEEPSGSVVFILICHQIGLLPATISSRCQKIYFQVENREEIIDWLSNQAEENGRLSVLLKAAHYAPLKALELLAANYFKIRDNLLSYLMKLTEKKVTPLDFDWDYKKDDHLLLLDIWLIVVQDILRLQLNIKEIFYSDCQSLLISWQKTFSVEAVQKISDALLQARKLLQGSIAVNAQLIIERLFIEWMEKC